MTRPPVTLERPIRTKLLLSVLQAHRRANRAKSRWERFTDLYTIALFAAYVAFASFAMLRHSTVGGPRPTGLIEDLPGWSSAILLLLFVAAARYSTWQGPVLFSRPDVEWVLSSPLSNEEIVRWRLRRGLAVAAGAGAMLGLGVFVVVEAELGVSAWPLLAATVGGLASYGLLVGGVGWLVECSTERARWVLRLSPIAMLAAGVFVLVPTGAARWVASWSGPWGWAAGPFLAAVGRPPAAWGFQLLLLEAIVAGSVWLAWAGAGSAPTEEFDRRAGLRSGLMAAASFVDLRSATLLARRGKDGLLRLRRLRWPRPRSRWLAVPWRDILGILRPPGRLAWTALLTTSGVLAVAAAPTRLWIVAMGVLAGYAAAARSIEALRADADRPEAHHVLPWRWGQLLLLHCLVPCLVLTAFGSLAVAVAWLAGRIPAAAVWPAIALSPLIALALVVCAAIAGQRGPFPAEILLTNGDMGVLFLMLWLVTGPLLAAAVLVIPAGIMQRTAGGGSLVAGTVASGAVLLVGVLIALGYLWSRRQPA